MIEVLDVHKMSEVLHANKMSEVLHANKMSVTATNILCVFRVAVVISKIHATHTHKKERWFFNLGFLTTYLFPTNLLFSN